MISKISRAILCDMLGDSAMLCMKQGDFNMSMLLQNVATFIRQEKEGELLKLMTDCIDTPAMLATAPCAEELDATMSANWAMPGEGL